MLLLKVMLRTLGVKTEDRLARLVQYFFTDSPISAAHNATTAATNGNGNGDDDDDDLGETEREEELLLHNPPEDVAELKELIRSENVIAAVKQYIEDISVEVLMHIIIIINILHHQTSTSSPQ